MCFSRSSRSARQSQVSAVRRGGARVGPKRTVREFQAGEHSFERDVPLHFDRDGEDRIYNTTDFTFAPRDEDGSGVDPRRPLTYKGAKISRRGDREDGYDYFTTGKVSFANEAEYNSFKEANPDARLTSQVYKTRTENRSPLNPVSIQNEGEARKRTRTARAKSTTARATRGTSRIRSKRGSSLRIGTGVQAGSTSSGINIGS